MLGQPVTCPFCGRPVAPPRNLGFQTSDFDAGICACGAVYVSDVTGYNQGAAFVEALVLACGGNWELAWELSPEEDYREVLLEGYDQKSHRIYSESEKRELGIRGVLYFLKLADDLKELNLDTIQRLREERRKKAPPLNIKPRKLRRPEAERLIREGKEEELLLLCRAQPVNLRALQKVLYSADPLLRWQAVILLGKAAHLVLQDRPDLIVDLIKRLIYASADSAASAWGALETVGEIIRRAPERFGIFVRNLLAFLKYPEYRPGALWALGRIGAKHPELLRRERILLVLRLLEDQDPQTRGLCAWLVGQARLFEGRKQLEALLGDQGWVQLYLPEKNCLWETTVGELAREALAQLDAQGG